MFGSSDHKTGAAAAQSTRHRGAPTDTASFPTIISEGVKIVGTITASGELVMNGELEGSIQAKSVTIGPLGSVKGDVLAETIVLSGTIEGNLRASRIEVEGSAKFRGEITYQAISISIGADVQAALSKFVGSITTDGKEASAPVLSLTRIAGGA